MAQFTEKSVKQSQTATGYLVNGRHVTASPTIPHSEATNKNCPCGEPQFKVGGKFLSCVKGHMYDLSGKPIGGF